MSSDLIELFHDVRLDQSEVLGFTIPATSAKAYLVAEDLELEWRGRAFYIDEIEDNRDGERTTITAECPALWYRLGDLTYVGSLLLDNLTPAEGLAVILDGTGWTNGLATTTSTDDFSFEGQDLSRLALLRAWSKITGRFLVFNTGPQTVDLVDSRGIDRGLGFRYGRNVKKVRRRRRPPEVTVLYPFGADGLSIAGINGGVPYVEDFSFYTAQGMTLTEARARYTRSRVWSDASFVRDVDLLPAAEARLAELAAGVVTYELDVVDLTELTGISETVQVGDTVRVQDPDFVEDVRTTVVRTVRFPLEPKRDRVELAHIPNPLDDPFSGSSRPSSSQEWIQFTGPTLAAFEIRNDGDYITNRIGLDFREGGRANFHLDLFATGVGDGTLFVEVLEAVSAVVAFHPVQIPYLDGQVVAAKLSWAAEQLSGQYDYRVRVTTVADGGPSTSLGVNIDQDVDYEAAFWIMAQGAVQEVPNLANSQRFDFVGPSGGVQQFTVPDNVTELTVEVAGAAGSDADSGPARTPGGAGAIVTATFTVTPGTIFDVVVGGRGGYPNGGSGDSTAVSNFGGSGGGSSDFRPNGGAFLSAFIIAAGGGGAGYRYNPATSTGGQGGFYAGGDGESAQGATQYAGGAGGTIAGPFGEAGDTDGQGFGGDAGDETSSFAEPGGGGGGGLHGGGGASAAAGNGAGLGGGAGGGGSSYADPAALDLLFVDGGNDAANGYVVFSWETPL